MDGWMDGVNKQTNKMYMNETKKKKDCSFATAAREEVILRILHHNKSSCMQQCNSATMSEWF